MSVTYQEKVLEVEPFGIEPIPKEERHGQIRQNFTLWFAINLNVVTWFTGFLGIEFGLSLKYAILAIILGNLLGAVFLALTSAIGPALGQPLIPASIRTFGKPGTIVLSFLNLINNIGWLAVNLVLAVMALQKILPLGYHSSLLVITAVTLIIAILGHNFIHSFAHWMSIIMGIFFIIITIIAVQKLPAMMSNSYHGSGEFNLGMFILTVAVTFSYQISYCPIGADYSRYLPENVSKFKVWLAAYWGMVTVSVWLEILGALTATLGMHAAPMDFFARLMGIFTVPALITVIVSTLPVNAIAVYSGGLAALAMGIPLKRWTSAIFTGGIGALLVSSGSGELAETYKNFLLLLSYWVAPWLGVVLSDFYFHDPAFKKGYRSNGKAGVIAFTCGVLISIPFMSSILYVGPIAKNFLGGTDISYFLSLIVSAIIYRLLSKAAIKKSMFAVGDSKVS